MAQTRDLDALLRGEKEAWGRFVRRYAGLIVAAVRSVAREAGEVEDLTQEVFLRLCKDDFRLLRGYDPARAGLSTWMTIVARSTARDAMRRYRPVSVPIELVPEGRLAVNPVEPVRKLDRRVYDRRVGWLAAHRRDERAVDLEAVDRQLAQVRER